jgi:DEAD/DEAH box helicase domain-containing protein
VLPSVLASQVRRGIEDFLRTTFPIHTPSFDGVIERLLDTSSREIFTGPYVSIKLPFRPGAGGRDAFPNVPLPFAPYLPQEQWLLHIGRAFIRRTYHAPLPSSALHWW